ncbi:hypothetical protein KL911_002117 [Ogataea haglerorum]|uniref:uncharacterized protein n=1 Tax=Ogataea haglerorum TaxID=1937702 RepID=UPI001C8AB55E|nr:uncharacterized protein KL911_002117 [Ogataea haglerorum]KAG7754678.1 hypothetical protein KL911_002117 [Ogataea haglerorum]
MYSALVTEAYDWEECQRAMNSYSFPKPEDSPQKSRRSSSQFNTPQTPTIQESDSESDEKTLQRADVSPRQHAGIRKKLKYDNRTGAAIQDDLASVLGRSSISLRSPVSSAQSSPKSEPAMTEECLCSPLLKEERSRMDSFSFGARPQCDNLPRELIDLDKVAHYS